jgi:hypothetical protein
MRNDDGLPDCIADVARDMEDIGEYGCVCSVGRWRRLSDELHCADAQGWWSGTVVVDGAEG